MGFQLGFERLGGFADMLEEIVFVPEMEHKREIESADCDQKWWVELWLGSRLRGGGLVV